MKRRLILGMLLLLSLAACSEEDFMEEKDTSQYRANLLLNGEPWTFTAISGRSNCDSDRLVMSLGYYNENNFRRMSLGISNFPAQPGKYTLLRRYSGQNECESNLIYASLHTLLDDGDVLGESFHIVEDAPDNELIITRYDSANQLLEGRFQMTFAVTELFRIDELDFPDTVRITYGSFFTDVLPPEE